MKARNEARRVIRLAKATCPELLDDEDGLFEIGVHHIDLDKRPKSMSAADFSDEVTDNIFDIIYNA
jgi:hypothetical protein